MGVRFANPTIEKEGYDWQIQRMAELRDVGGVVVDRQRAGDVRVLAGRGPGGAPGRGADTPVDPPGDGSPGPGRKAPGRGRGKRPVPGRRAVRRPAGRRLGRGRLARTRRRTPGRRQSVRGDRVDRVTRPAGHLPGGLMDSTTITPGWDAPVNNTGRSNDLPK